MHLRIQAQRPFLRLVPTPSAPALEWAWFCGRCAAAAPRDQAPSPSERVCRSCGFGLLLETRRDIVPTAKDAFLVLDGSLLVQAVSRRAERLLGIAESDTVNRPFGQLLVPADAEAQARARFAEMITEVIATEEPVETFVRPADTFGVRMRVRIAQCGPPKAALLVFQPPRPRLRAV